MKLVKIVLVFLVLAGTGFLLQAQSLITIDASQQFTSFRFKNASGDVENKNYSGILSGTYGVGYKYSSEKGLQLRAGLSLRNAGATMVYDDMNYTWNLQYASVCLGGGYAYKLGKISPYIIVSGYYGYLLKAFQTINNENFNILKSKSVNNTDYGLLVSPGVNMKLSDAVSAYAEFCYLHGLQNLEKDPNQESTNYAYSLKLGLAFTITK